MILRNLACSIRQQDWEIATTQAADQLEEFTDRLDRHVAARIRAGAP